VGHLPAPQLRPLDDGLLEGLFGDHSTTSIDGL
jgi:hypothetical protein